MQLTQRGDALEFDMDWHSRHIYAEKPALGQCTLTCDMIQIGPQKVKVWYYKDDYETPPFTYADIFYIRQRISERLRYA